MHTITSPVGPAQLSNTVYICLPLFRRRGLWIVLVAVQSPTMSGTNYSRLTDPVRSWLGFQTSCANNFLTVEARVPLDCSAANPWIRFAGDFRHSHGKQLEQAYTIASSEKPVLPHWISQMPGMSGSKFRPFLNQLVASQSHARYLEIGSWKGSTACSAIYGNRARIVCVDNWSLFGGPRHEFFANIGKCISDEIDFSCFETDYREFDYSETGPFNIYFYDGPHDEQNQHYNLIAIQDALDKHFFLVVDDWNWPSVRTGTKRALRQLGTRIMAFAEIRTSGDNKHAKHPCGPRSDWHNGYFIAACTKKRPNLI